MNNEKTNFSIHYNVYTVLIYFDANKFADSYNVERRIDG